MALLFVDSFDHLASADLFKKWSTPYFGQAPTIVAGEGRCGSSALYHAHIGGAIKGITVTGTANVGFAGFAFRGLTNLFGNSMFQVYHGGTVQWYAYWQVDGSIAIYNGTNTYVAATPADGLRAGAYAFVEFGWTISATVGAITVRVNNVAVLTATSLNLRASTAPSDAWTGIALVGANNATSYVDDLYVCDNTNDGLTPATHTFLGDVRVEYLRPTADGASSAWTVTGGGTHANAVDKDADSTLTTPAITSATPGTRDTNAYSNPSVTSGACFGVQVNLLAVKDTAGPTTIGAVVRHSGTDAVQAASSPSQTTPRYEITTLDRNPVTVGAWTLAQVAAAEFGVDRVT